MKDTIKEYLAGQYDAYVKDLETLTNIDSGNGDLQGTEAANKFVAEKMQDPDSPFYQYFEEYEQKLEEGKSSF